MPLNLPPDPPDSGRALIPWESLPPAVTVPARVRRRTMPPSDPARQLSLFGVESVDASPIDLSGLLVGPGLLHRMGGTARVTVPLDAAWRVHALIPELAARGLEASWLPSGHDPDGDDPGGFPEAEPGGAAEADPGGAAEADPAGGGSPRTVRFEVRTAYSSLLAGLVRGWLVGTAKRAPERFFLTGPRLRLWVLAAGSPHPSGYLLGLGAGDAAQVWAAADAALTRVGLPGVVLDAQAGGPGVRITGRRRLARLAELVGERPPAAPEGAWPGV